jgi:hypothetical protein
MGASQYARRKQSRRRPIQRTAGSPGDLVKRSQRQPTAREAVVKIWHPKGQDPARNPVPSLDSADLLA